MIKTKTIKKIAASICAVISLCPAFNVYADLLDEQKNCPDFSQIKSQTYDSTTLDNTISDLEEIAKSRSIFSKAEEVKKLLEVLVDEYEHLSTVINLYSINYYCDITDRSLSQKSSDIQKLYLEKYNNVTQCMEDLYNAGFEDELRDASGHDLVEVFLEEADDGMSDEEFENSYNKNSELITQVNEIINEYYSYTENDYSVEYKGKTWVLSDLFNDISLSDDEYKEAAKLIHDKRNNLLGNLYLRLISLRQELAELNGYDNYAEYAYEQLYILDYSSEDTDKIYENVKKYFSDNYEDFSDESAMNAYYSGLSDIDFTSQKVLDTVTPFFNQVDEDISQRFEHLKSHNLYDISESDVKSGDSFMDSLYEYSVPFVFVTPLGDYNDLISLIHEFGHANAEYAKPSSAIESELGSSHDTCEMHSQGMEILFTHYSEQLLGEDMGKSLNQIIINDMIDSIVQGCLYDEFQKYAYKNTGCTLDDLNRKYEELCGEYGVEYSDEDPYLYDWVEITHNFESPMYYITYATSAVSVLDLWLQSMNDMDMAVDMYEKIVECDQYMPYRETAKTCGLATIFDEDALKEIAYQTEYFFEHDTIDPGYKSELSGDMQTTDAVTESVSESTSAAASSSMVSDETEITVTKKTNIDNQNKTVFFSMFFPIAVRLGCILIGIIITVVVVKCTSKKRKNDQNDDINHYE